MFEKISRGVGFTVTEMKAILFLLLALIAGMTYKYFYLNDVPPLQKFDYSVQDSLFTASSQAGPEQNAPGEGVKVDYKQEVLDFNKTETTGKKRTDLLKDKSIDLNKAGLPELMLLPGVGETTAKRIVLYRDEKGRFRSVSELMNVKGIGEKKFEKIKRFIFVD